MCIEGCFPENLQDPEINPVFKKEDNPDEEYCLYTYLKESFAIK